MTAVTAVWSAAWTLVAVAVAIRLWRMSAAFEPSLRSGYRWFAAAALCLGAGGTLQQTLGGSIGGAQPLRLADLISLAALPALIIGVRLVTSQRPEPDHGSVQAPRGQVESSRWWRHHDRSILARLGTSVVLDSALLVVSLFAIGLVVMFGGDYTRSGVQPASFVLDLIRPLADLAALGLVLMLAPRRPRLAAFVVLSLVVVTVADSLAVASRSVGNNPGAAAHVALLAGIALLAGVPSPRPRPLKADEHAGTWSSWLAGIWSAQARMAAPLAAAIAALVIAGFAVFGHPVATSAVAVTGAIGVLLLVVRLGWFARQAGAVKASEQASDLVLQALVDSTSDTVLVCDRGGMIEYVSHGSSEFGYVEGNLIGTQLADIVHPEDRPAGIRAAMTALRSDSGTAMFSGRARGADGSWRQVKATLSRYGQPGEPARLLITCHDDSELHALRRQVTQLTFHDGLTGLPNRTYLEDRVKDLSQDGDGRGVVAAILVGLDYYSTVPENGGQSGENLVLAQAGRRLRTAATPGAIVARWGAEQFAILVTDAGGSGQQIADWPALTELADRLSDAIGGEPFAVSAKEVQITASVGVAVSSVADADQVLGNAQLAMSKASEAGGARIELFGERMRAMARRRLELSGGLAEAIADHELVIEYVPVVELATSRVSWVEAVINWPAAGESVSAGELLSVAEDSGLIVKMGEWALREATHQIASWGQPPPGVALRVSAQQLGVPSFAASVLTALDEAALPPEALMLQIDERVLIRGAVSIRSELAELRRRGVKIAIDGYGTGYTSLSHLRELAVDAIKIDSSLIAGVGSDPTLTLLTSAIAGLGRDLGIDTIATGVERPDQVEVLMAMGCRLGQGFWLTNLVSANSSPDQAGDPACSPAS